MTAFLHLRLILGVGALLLTTHTHAKHVKVILLGGQSNMIGTQSLTSELPPALQAPQADVMVYNGGLTTLRPDGTWFGPQVTFGRAIADAFPLETFCLIKYAANGTSLLTNWNPTTGATYASFRTLVANGLAALTAAGHTYEIAGILWTQGEADVGSTTPIYESALNGFIADIRTRYGQNTPFFVSRLSTAQTSLSANGLSTIRAAQEYVALNDPLTYLIDTDAMSVYTGDHLHFNAAGQIALGQAFGQSYIASVAPDTTAPVQTLLSPANEFAGHPATNNLVINFSESIVFGTGYITVRKTADGTLVERYDVANPSANLALRGATLTIDLSSNLNYSTGYYVEIDPTALKDPSGNSFAGFSGSSTWSFSTAASQAGGLIAGSGINPTASEVNPSSSYSLMGSINGVGLNSSGEHGSGGQSEWLTGIGGDIANGFISFDLGGAYVLDSMHVWNCTQFVNYGVKQLDIYVSDVFSPGDPEGAGAANWTKIANNVLFPAAGAPNVGFDLETQIGISLPATAVRHVRFEIDTRQQDASTGGYVGLAEVQFVAAGNGPDSTEPSASSLNPLNGASGVSTTANFNVTFSEPVAFGTGFITVRETAGGTPVASYDVANPPANLSLSGATLTINPTADLAASTGYYVEIDPTAIDDLAGNSFAGFSGSLTWSFTAGSPDTTQPTISSLNPANGATGVSTTANLVLTFSEPVAFGTGSITVRKTVGGTSVASYNVASPPANLSLSGATLTINPTADLNYSTGYYVEIDPTAIDDLVGNSFAGISGSATWSFITAAAQTGGLINYTGITPTASDKNNNTTAFSLMGSINGAGLNGSNQHGSGNGTEWYTNNGQVIPEAWIAFDLGASYVLDSIHVWNTVQYLDYGINQVDIYVSNVETPGDPEGTGAGNWTKIGNNVSFAKTLASPTAGFDLETQTGISLPTIPVRHVRFEVDSTFGTNYVGLAEIQFFAAASPANDFTNWISHYPSVGGLTGLNDDPDHDGNANGLENFFGTDPSAFTAGLASGGVSDNTFTFTHPLNASLASDISATYHWSKNMGSFNADGATADGTRVDFVRGAPSGGMVTVTATTTGTSIDKLFVKVGVTRN